jgi:hypothetical protein
MMSFVKRRWFHWTAALLLALGATAETRAGRVVKVPGARQAPALGLRAGGRLFSHSTADDIEKRSFTMSLSTWLSGTSSHSQMVLNIERSAPDSPRGVTCASAKNRDPESWSWPNANDWPRDR